MMALVSILVIAAAVGAVVVVAALAREAMR